MILYEDQEIFIRKCSWCKKPIKWKYTRLYGSQTLDNNHHYGKCLNKQLKLNL